jgi:hypothetical protein
MVISAESAAESLGLWIRRQESSDCNVTIQIEHVNEFSDNPTSIIRLISNGWTGGKLTQWHGYAIHWRNEPGSVRQDGRLGLT